MTPQNLHNQDADQETLSALFDGELDGDAARFAMRRLDHDDAWRDACGRWQLLGDVLRGQATAQAPAGFAARVETALAAERTDHVAAATGTAGRMSVVRRWTRSRMGGAALAASVAFVAFLAVRPGLDERAPAGQPGMLTAAPTAGDSRAPASQAPSPATRVASVPQAPVAPAADSGDAGDPTPARPTSEIGLAAAAVAVAELPRRARSQNSSRSQAQRAGLRAARHDAPVQVASAAAAVAASTADSRVASLPPTAALHPFLPAAEDIPSRPWPSATLPDSTAGTLTASYRMGGFPVGDRVGSFYPFEPRLPEAQAEALLEALRVEPPPPREGPRR